MMTVASKVDAGRRRVLAGIIAAAGLFGASSAVSNTPPGMVGLEVVDRGTGAELPVWRHGGRAYVAGASSTRYGLRVSNHTGGRVLLVLSVDGVNVLTGETARYNQQGYVLGPYETYDVNGWRKSQAEVAAFTFASLPQSYAARTGRPGDVGVIGMAVFAEKAQPTPRSEAPPVSWIDRRRAADDAGSLAAPPPPLPLPAVKAPMPEASRRAAPPPAVALGAPGVDEARSSPESHAVQRRDEKLGTAHGAREWSLAEETTFVRATPYPQSIRQIEYDTYANLSARGVVPATPVFSHRPRPFPSEHGEVGFVPDPPEER